MQTFKEDNQKKFQEIINNQASIKAMYQAVQNKAANLVVWSRLNLDDIKSTVCRQKSVIAEVRKDMDDLALMLKQLRGLERQIKLQLAQQS